METYRHVNSQYQSLLAWEAEHDYKQYFVYIPSRKQTVLYRIVALLVCIGIGMIFVDALFSLFKHDIRIALTISENGMSTIGFAVIFLGIIYLDIKFWFYLNREMTAVKGYYFSIDEFLEVSSYKTKIKVKTYPYNQIVTFDLILHTTLGNPNRRVLCFIICMDQEKMQLTTTELFQEKLLLRKARYQYFLDINNITTPYFTYYSIVSDGDIGVYNIEQLKNTGRDLLMKYNPKKEAGYYYPELHCGCGTINDLQSRFCDNCGQEIDTSNPRLAETD